jgi:hypothetical protein
VESEPSRNFRGSDALGAAALGKSAGVAGLKRPAPEIIEVEASVTDSDDDQAATQDGQTSDDDSEEASGNAIKVTHDTPLGSNGDGADQLIKTFGILNAAAFGTGFFSAAGRRERPATFDRPARRGRIVEPDQSDATCPVLAAKIF